MKKVWEKDFGYTFFRPYIQWAVRNTYSKITVKGLENIPDPKEVSVLIAGNHCNCLMDALVLLQARKEPTAFVARADIFKNPFIAKILGNLRILPIYRQRDGGDSKAKNVAIFDNVVECLNQGMAFSVFPEGTHRPHRSLLPIKKGVFRMAQQAVAENPGKKVVIVPMGLEYDDYFNIMRPVTISFGEPMEIKGGEVLDELAEELRVRISGLITYFPYDDEFEEKEKAFEESKKPSFGLVHRILAVLLLPLFILTGFLCLPMLLATAFFKSKIKDRTWYNTIRFAGKLALTPFTVIGAAVAGFSHLSWLPAVILVIATLYAHPIFYRILIFYKRLLAK